MEKLIKVMRGTAAVLVIISIIGLILCFFLPVEKEVNKGCDCEIKELKFDSTRIGEKIDEFTYEEYFLNYKENYKLYKKTGNKFYLNIVEHSYEKLSK